jgi:hypothetical protein
MLPVEEISAFERVFVVIITMTGLLALLYAMAILVEKYMLCKERKMKISLFSGYLRQIQIQ